jgi:hypothetical protein
MIITVHEGKTTHYYRIVNGRLQPLSDQQVHALRLDGVPIELPETAVLRPECEKETAVP